MLSIDFYSLLGLSVWNKSIDFLTTLVIIIVYKIKFGGMKFQYPFLSDDVAPGSEITPCNKKCKPLAVYRFSGNVMTSIKTLRT